MDYDSDDSVVEVAKPEKPPPIVIRLEDTEVVLNVTSEENVAEVQTVISEEIDEIIEIPVVQSRKRKNPYADDSAASVSNSSPYHWTADMKQFYDDIHDDEINFDVGHIQKKMKPDWSFWTVGVIPPKHRRYHPYKEICEDCGRSHGGKRCPFACCVMCSEKGHKMNNCPRAKCLTCGIRTRSFVDSCDNCRRTITRVRCPRCYVAGHNLVDCPDHWRRFHHITNFKVVKAPTTNPEKPPHQLWCCNCGKKGHLEVNCMLPRCNFFAPTSTRISSYLSTYNVDRADQINFPVESVDLTIEDPNPDLAQNNSNNSSTRTVSGDRHSSAIRENIRPPWAKQKMPPRKGQKTRRRMGKRKAVEGEKIATVAEIVAQYNQPAQEVPKESTPSNGRNAAGSGYTPKYPLRRYFDANLGADVGPTNTECSQETQSENPPEAVPDFVALQNDSNRNEDKTATPTTMNNVVTPTSNLPETPKSKARWRPRNNRRNREKEKRKEHNDNKDSSHQQPETSIPNPDTCRSLPQVDFVIDQRGNIDKKLTENENKMQRNNDIASISHPVTSTPNPKSQVEFFIDRNGSANVANTENRKRKNPKNITKFLQHRLSTPNRDMSPDMAQVNRDLAQIDQDIEQFHQHFQNFFTGRKGSAHKRNRGKKKGWQSNFNTRIPKHPVSTPDISRDLAQASRDFAQANRSVAQASRDIAQANRDVAQASRGFAQANRDVAQASRDVVQANRNVAQASRDIAQVNRDLAQVDRDMAQVNRDLEQVEFSIDRKGRSHKLNRKMGWRTQSNNNSIIPQSLMAISNPHAGRNLAQVDFFFDRRRGPPVRPFPHNNRKGPPQQHPGGRGADQDVEKWNRFLLGL